MNSMVLSTTIMQLMCLVVRSLAYHDPVNLIIRLNEFYRFDHRIFFVDSTTDLDRWFLKSASKSKRENFTPQTVYTFDNLSDSDFDITEVSLVDVKFSKNPFLIVVLGSLQFDNGSKFFANVKRVRGIDLNVKIGVFFYHSINSLGIVEELFRWSRSAGIVNIFSAFYFGVEGGEASFNVLKYDPFGTFDLINVTRSVSLRNYFLYKRPNYRGHPLRCLNLIDLNQTSVESKFWDTLRLVFNASLSNVNRGTAEYEKFGPLNEEIIPYEASLSVYNLGRTLYPHRQGMLAMIVPHAKPYADFGAYLRNGTWTLFFIYTFTVIAASSLLLIVSAYLRKKKILLLQSIVDVVNLLINDNAAIRYRSLHRADVFVVVPLTFVGLIVMSGILSVFQSYITSPIYEPQIKTFEDLYKSSVPIIANEVYWRDLLVKLMEISTNLDGWNRKVHGISLDVLKNETRTFNNSIAFFTLDHQARPLLEAQKRLTLKAYHLLSNIFLSKYLASYQIRPDFPYIESINDIVHRLNGAGLTDRWLKEEDEIWVTNILKRNLNRQINFDNGSDVAEVTVPTVIWCGWIASAVTFICELIWYKINSYQRARIEQ